MFIFEKGQAGLLKQMEETYRHTKADILKQKWWYNQETKMICDLWLPGGLPGDSSHAMSDIHPCSRVPATISLLDHCPGLLR